jgi:hypothetical protein
MLSFIIFGIVVSIFCAGIALLANELPFRNSWGGFVDDNVLEMFAINEEKLNFKNFGETQLNTLPRIVIKESMLSKYFIDSIGRVPRFSKTHYEIERLFKVCRDKSKPKKIVSL